MNFLKRKFYQLKSNFYKNKLGAEIPFVSAKYYLNNERELNIVQPTEFMEKLQWLRQYFYTQDFGKYVDKYDVRTYVESKVGPKVLVNVIGIHDKVEDINFDTLPKQFALKGTHGSGYNIIVHDKSQIDIDEVKRKLNKFLGKNYFNKYKEFIYKDVHPRILIEEYLDQSESKNIIDYKFYCIDGKPKYVLVKTMDEGIFKKCFYDLSWNKIPNDIITDGYLTKEIVKPSNFNELISVATKLSDDFVFLRVDLYSIKNKIYFGELTFFPTGALKRLPIERLNQELGDMIELPKLADA